LTALFRSIEFILPFVAFGSFSLFPCLRLPRPPFGPRIKKSIVLFFYVLYLSAITEQIWEWGYPAKTLSRDPLERGKQRFCLSIIIQDICGAGSSETGKGIPHFRQSCCILIFGKEARRIEPDFFARVLQPIPKLRNSRRIACVGKSI